MNEDCMSWRPQRNEDRGRSKRAYHTGTSPRHDSADASSYRFRAMFRTNRFGSAAAATLCAVLLTSQGSAETTRPAVARPVLNTAGAAADQGVVFFVPFPSKAGVIAIGTAHTLDRREVAAAGEVEFLVGNSTQSVARSRGYWVPPGVPFSANGATFRDDFVVYSLRSAPTAVRTLKIDSEPIERRSRVRILGIPIGDSEPSVEVKGVVAKVSMDRIEIDLDQPTSLRGWGGAPVVSQDTGRVVGIVQAADPNRDVPRITAAPIGGVSDALDKRAADSQDELAFAQFGEIAAPASVATASETSRRAPGELQPIILPLEPEPAEIELTIEYPSDGIVMADTACGAFVAGRAIALEGASQRFDVAIVLDTSGSTEDLTGSDINGNGVIGTPHMGRMSSLFGESTTDPGDTILAAEVAAARQLLRGLDPRSTRVALVTFAGGIFGAGHGDQRPTRQAMPAAMTRSPLTHDFHRVETALDRVLKDRSGGETDMAAGIRFGFQELNGLQGSRSEVRDGTTKLMFFFTDGEPTAPHGVAARTDNYLAVAREAQRAKRLGVRIHSFAIGPLAINRPIAAVAMADITDGYFTPVRHPGELSEIIDAVGFANLEDVTIQSVTTGKRATPFRIAADGSWGGFVKLSDGKNQIEVAARASNGGQTLRHVNVISEPAAQPEVIPPELAIRHNRLLEDCLRNEKVRTVAAEKEHAEIVRRELMLQIDRDRARARERAEQQRKQLDLEIEE
jgi:hypothetical protein